MAHRGFLVFPNCQLDGDQLVVDRNHWRDAVFDALQALPRANAPPACGWDSARKSHGYPTDKITPKSAEDLVAFGGKHHPSGASNEQAFGMAFWAAVMWAGIAYLGYQRYYVAPQGVVPP